MIVVGLCFNSSVTFMKAKPIMLLLHDISSSHPFKSQLSFPFSGAAEALICVINSRLFVLVMGRHAEKRRDPLFIELDSIGEEGLE